MIQISGQVIHGERYGKALGFPTANLDRRSFRLRRTNIRLGVYAGWAELPSGKKYRAAIVIGPIYNHHLPKIEAHLIGFKANLYGKKIIIELQKYLRPFRKFKSETALKQQIARDLKKIK